MLDNDNRPVGLIPLDEMLARPSGWPNDPTVLPLMAPPAGSLTGGSRDRTCSVACPIGHNFKWPLARPPRFRTSTARARLFASIQRVADFFGRDGRQALDTQASGQLIRERAQIICMSIT